MCCFIRNYVKLMNVQMCQEKLRYSDKFSKKPGQVYKLEECQEL